ncbi:MAG: hypothetical protein HYY52_08580 [Candidatus Melainabacteria bacterium]|nr:hypothetical protein [Candidatus Melainabacteria bacterium]
MIVLNNNFCLRNYFVGILFFLTIFFAPSINIAYAEEPKVLNYDKQNKTIKVKIEGKEYTLDVPIEEANVEQEISQDTSLQGKVKKKKYARGPATTTVGPRLYNIPTDNLLQRNGFAFDFTHRFTGPIDESTANDLYGLDTFARASIGLYYGITNNIEAHAFRSSLTDASEFGLKYQIFKEARNFGEGAPFGLTLSSGFQNDNIQNSIDFYVQPIISKVIIPSWMKVYVAPTWADKSATIGMANSLSASFFTFTDPKSRGYKRSSGTFALPIGAALQIWPNKLSIFGEYTPVLSGYREVKNGWAFGLQILSKLETHVWTIGISNVPYSTFGQFIVGGPSNNLHFGFNIAAKIK